MSKLISCYHAKDESVILSLEIGAIAITESLSLAIMLRIYIQLPKHT